MSNNLHPLLSQSCCNGDRRKFACILQNFYIKRTCILEELSYLSICSFLWLGQNTKIKDHKYLYTSYYQQITATIYTEFLNVIHFIYINISEQTTLILPYTKGQLLKFAGWYKGNLVQVLKGEKNSLVYENPGPFPIQNFKKYWIIHFYLENITA